MAVADLDLLVQTSDLSEADLLNPARLSAPLGELVSDVVRRRAKRLEEFEPRAPSLYEVALPGSRPALGDATPADFEIARIEIERQARELSCQRRWLALIEQALPTGKTVREALRS